MHTKEEGIGGLQVFNCCYSIKWKAGLDRDGAGMQEAAELWGAMVIMGNMMRNC